MIGYTYIKPHEHTTSCTISISTTPCNSKPGEMAQQHIIYNVRALRVTIFLVKVAQEHTCWHSSKKTHVEDKQPLLYAVYWELQTCTRLKDTIIYSQRLLRRLRQNHRTEGQLWTHENRRNISTTRWAFTQIGK
jgi:hypothetical protein